MGSKSSSLKQEDSSSEEGSSSDDDEMVSTRGFLCRRRRRRSRKQSTRATVGYLIGCAFALWLLEFLVVLGLKRFGVLDPRFRLDEAVAQKVLPQLEQGWNRLNESIPPSYLAQFEQGWSRLNQSIPLSYLTQQTKRPGFQLAQKGAKANYPVVMMPGFVTSGLEVWGGKECARSHFRQRLWAAIGGARSFLTDRECWKEHMMLSLKTGVDPTDIRLRAAQGFEAADYFMANYWVFGKIIENLADLGYSPSEMTMEPYDWRLAFPLLEKRDGYLTKLRHTIEAMHKTTGKKIVLTSHSMGGMLVHYFFKWVTTSESKGGGGGGKHWVDEHIHAYVNIAGSHLGVVKAATALLSGEMSDTILMGTMGSMLEQFFGRRQRRDLWTTWGSLWTMLPLGGNSIWGSGADMCLKRSAEDPMCPEEGLSPLMVMTDAKENAKSEMNATIDIDSSLKDFAEDFVSYKSHTAEDVADFLIGFGAARGHEVANPKMVSVYGDDEKPSSRTWHDPTRTPLPYAPNMKIYCMYGVGVATERAYYYQGNREEAKDEAGPGQDLQEPPVVLDPTVNDAERNVTHGIRYSDGDGSVPLISLGYVCVDLWKRRETGLNPSQTAVHTREYHHSPGFCVDDPMRGGPSSSDHVDILGNMNMMEDFLRVVSDFEISEVNNDKISSDIKHLSEEITAHKRKRTKKKAWFTR
jgi:phospholipid:diacylglycerol acyltransferase